MLNVHNVIVVIKLMNFDYDNDIIVCSTSIVLSRYHSKKLMAHILYLFLIIMFYLITLKKINCSLEFFLQWSYESQFVEQQPNENESVIIQVELRRKMSWQLWTKLILILLSLHIYSMNFWFRVLVYNITYQRISLVIIFFSLKQT